MCTERLDEGPYENSGWLFKGAVVRPTFIFVQGHESVRGHEGGDFNVQDSAIIKVGQAMD